MVLAVTNDLMAAAPIEHAARQLGVECRAITACQLNDVDRSDDLQVVVVDLNAVDQVAEVIATVRSSVGESVPIIAFGPHVHVAKLEAAKEAGCSQVLTRGQFHQATARIISAAVADAT